MMVLFRYLCTVVCLLIGNATVATVAKAEDCANPQTFAGDRELAVYMALRHMGVVGNCVIGPLAKDYCQSPCDCVRKVFDIMRDYRPEETERWQKTEKEFFGMHPQYSCLTS